VRAGNARRLERRSIRWRRPGPEGRPVNLPANRLRRRGYVNLPAIRLRRRGYVNLPAIRLRRRGYVSPP